MMFVFSQLLFPVVYAAVGVSGSQKGDNFRVTARVLTAWSFWHHRRQSVLVGVGGQKSQNNWLVTEALFFLLPSTRFVHVSHLVQNAAGYAG